MPNFFPPAGATAAQYMNMANPYAAYATTAGATLPQSAATFPGLSPYQGAVSTSALQEARLQ